VYSSAPAKRRQLKQPGNKTTVQKGNAATQHHEREKKQTTPLPFRDNNIAKSQQSRPNCMGIWNCEKCYINRMIDITRTSTTTGSFVSNAIAKPLEDKVFRAHLLIKIIKVIIIIALFLQIVVDDHRNRGCNRSHQNSSRSRRMGRRRG